MIEMRTVAVAGLVVLLGLLPAGCHLIFPFDPAAPPDAAPDGAPPDAALDGPGAEGPLADGPAIDRTLPADKGPPDKGPSDKAVPPDKSPPDKSPPDTTPPPPAWKPLTTSGLPSFPTTQRPTIWGVSQHEIYVAAGSSIYLCDDKDLAKTALSCSVAFSDAMTNTPIHDLGGFGSGVFAAGAPDLLRAKASGWSDLCTSLNHDFRGLWCVASTECLLTGTKLVGPTTAGVVTHVKGSSFVDLATFPSVKLTAVWSTGGTIVAVGQGCAVRFQTGTGGTWTSIVVSSCTADLLGVWGSSATDYHVVGVGGLRLHAVGGILKTVGTGGQNLNDLWGSDASHVYAVGDQGVVRSYDGGGWSSIQQVSAADLTSVWGVGPSHVYAVGTTGVVLRYH